VTHGIVSVSWAPLRREPRHAAEMVSQALLGEVLVVTPRAASIDDQWAAVTTPDGYTGFLTTGSFRGCDTAEAADWQARASGFSLGTALTPVPDSTDVVPGHAPWGSRLEVTREGVTLPGGNRAIASDPSALAPHSHSSVAESAATWLGTPYLWGGRTRHGADCSGFVQAVYALHGVGLRRDSRDQFEAGPAIDGPPAVGDLVFFAWEGRPISHVGLSFGDGRFIHASETRGCVAIDTLGEGAFGRRLADGHVGTVRPVG
jgi:cell wall-associated NlpC family hydrolase